METFVCQLDPICCLNFVVHAEVRGELRAEHVRQGLRAIQARHPLLRVRIETDGRRAAYFRSGTPTIPLRVLEVGEAEWLAEMEYELNTRLPSETGPLIRCVLLRHSESESRLMVCFHHVIAGAVSGAYVMRDLVQAASCACAGQEASLPALKTRPSFQEHFPKRTKGVRGWWRYLKLVGTIRGDLRKNGTCVRPKEDSWSPLAERRTFSVPFRFEADFVEALIAKARREQTTVYGALGAALALATARDIGASEKVRLAFGGAVSVRDALEVPVGEDCGAFASGVGAFLDVKDAGVFWELAREIKWKLSRSIARDEQFLILPKVWGLYAALGRWLGWGQKGRDRFAWLLGKLPPPQATVTHSNIGRLDFAHQYGPLTIQSMGIDRALSSLSLLGSTATTLNGVLYWHIGGSEPLLNRDRIRAIAEEAAAILTRAVDAVVGR